MAPGALLHVGFSPWHCLLLLLSALFLPHATIGQSHNNGRIDRVLHVDASPSQLVVVTSKDGPVEGLLITITLTDIAEGRTNPPFIAGGLWLLVNRGRYTIPFLRPDRWYGVQYTAERGFGDNKETHTEFQLVKTPARGAGGGMGGMGALPGMPGAEESPSASPVEPALFDLKVRMHRAGPEHTENVEGIYITVRWISKDRINGSELAVDLRVKCDNSVANEDIVLPWNQEGITVEIAMDHKYELEEVNSTMHQIMAHITPLRCHEICWRPWLRTTVATRIFSRDYGEQCHQVGGTTSVTFLRNFKYYTLHDGELVVETEHHKGAEVDEGFVSLSAVPLGASHNESDPVVQKFRTEDSDGRFSLQLEEPGYYAVTYEYTKVKPFHYTTEERFLVESEGGTNSSKRSKPLVEIRYEPYKLVKDPDRQRQEDPAVLIGRPMDYAGVNVDVYFEPFCGIPDTHKALCEQNAKFYFCPEMKGRKEEKKEGRGDSKEEDVVYTSSVNSTVPDAEFVRDEGLEEVLSAIENSTYLYAQSDKLTSQKESRMGTGKCGPLLCYTVEVEAHGERYSMGSRCSDIRQHFDMVTTGAPRLTTVLLSLLAWITVLYR